MRSISRKLLVKKKSIILHVSQYISFISTFTQKARLKVTEWHFFTQDNGKDVEFSVQHFATSLSDCKKRLISALRTLEMVNSFQELNSWLDELIVTATYVTKQIKELRRDLQFWDI